MANSVTQLIPVPVHRHTLFVANAAEPMVPLKPICEALGLDWKTQHRKLRNHPTFAEGMVIMTIPSAGGAQETACLSIWMLPGWLMTIHPSNVHPRAREAVITFQREASRLLYEAWWGTRHGLPAPSGRPKGDLLEAVEGPPPLREHPAVARAIAMSIEAGQHIAQAFRQSREMQRDARREAARAGLSGRELRILVERERHNASRPAMQSPLFDV
ncbi:MAG: phage antirepressor N-terminal domain-containing protein [Roseococcus sp.]|nr:phage antirepressor N-terminal domain-containing protein [Roseococcus sp.]